VTNALPAILTNSVAQTKVGATIGTANGSSLTNLTYKWVIAPAGDGLVNLGKLTITNLTGNITLNSMSGVDTTMGVPGVVLAIADGSTRTVALPANCFSADGVRTYYVTNGTARIFAFTVYGSSWTNCSCVPSF
jgi:hypothetical protein